jgi:NADPH:quinone reductase-like Zn-dependent oxidoreductase
VKETKSFRAEVTGVCSTRNLELVSSIGADEVIDYKKEDFTKQGQIYDTIFDAAAKSSFSKSKNSLSQEGTFVSTAVTLKLLLQKRWNSMRKGKKVKTMLADVNVEDYLKPVNDLIVAGKLKPVIGGRYPLSQIADAHRLVEEGRASGKVIVTP